MATGLKTTMLDLRIPVQNLANRAYNPIQILGSTINMVNIPIITDWITGQIDGYRAREGNRVGDVCLDGTCLISSGLLGLFDPVTGKNLLQAKQLLVTGFHGLNQAREDPTYRQIGSECDLWVPDSIAPVMIARWRGIKHAVRTPGAEIMAAFLVRASERGFRSYFYGGSESTLSILREKLERTYPGHVVAGTYSPPFRPLGSEEEQKHIDMINEARPDVLWVGLGLPKQDEWIYRCKDRLRVPVAAGVGAAFGFLAGTIRRAPPFICNIGLEWAYMVLRKPKRTFRRVFVEGSEFVWHVLLEELLPGRKSEAESNS